MVIIEYSQSQSMLMKRYIGSVTQSSNETPPTKTIQTSEDMYDLRYVNCIILWTTCCWSVFCIHIPRHGFSTFWYWSIACSTPFWKTLLTFTYESTIKCLLEWDRVTPFMEKVRFSCMWDNLMKCHSKGETWIEVGWKNHTLVTSMRMGLNNSFNLLNVRHHLCVGNFSIHVLNMEIGDSN